MCRDDNITDIEDDAELIEATNEAIRAQGGLCFRCHAEIRLPFVTVERRVYCCDCGKPVMDRYRE
jgi:hypothetical protein